MSNQVALVLDDKVTESIRSFFNKIPVWIIRTDENDEAIKGLQHHSESNRLITTFHAKEGESKIALAERILYTLDDHHNEHSYGDTYDTLLVSGLTLQESKLDAFRDLGFSEFEEADFGFIARKCG
jgi:hypothetical protein